MSIKVLEICKFLDTKGLGYISPAVRNDCKNSKWLRDAYYDLFLWLFLQVLDVFSCFHMAWSNREGNMGLLHEWYRVA